MRTPITTLFRDGKITIVEYVDTLRGSHRPEFHLSPDQVTSTPFMSQKYVGALTQN